MVKDSKRQYRIPIFYCLSPSCTIFLCACVSLQGFGCLGRGSVCVSGVLAASLFQPSLGKLLYVRFLLTQEGRFLAASLFEPSFWAGFSLPRYFSLHQLLIVCSLLRDSLLGPLCYNASSSYYICICIVQLQLCIAYKLLSI